ncbi:hypothetical protein INT46_002425 [Mucor plumbeus]|uniref:CCHC-type domain-containing protein n=1 Tax=Mucor plumbeus TaxID=97098 RepID=A0A8H7QJC4_9FUNG|nr:hypothetical protein INT46_002425 [Mucor plumbeus]
MALSDKQTLSKGEDLIGGGTKDSRHNPNKLKDPMRSYAQILKNDQTRDTFDLNSKSSGELGHLTEGGQLFIQARDKHSIVVSAEQFLDSQANFKEVGVLLRAQYPEAWGLRIRNVGQDSKYFEVNFRTDEAREAALKKDFQYEGKKVIVSRTFPKDTTIVRVSISNLPYDEEDILKAEMSKIFVKYGEILEMGLLYTAHGHFFNGRGFVTLNLIPGKIYEKLVPQIDSWESKETLKLTYTGMKPICSRCHVSDHVLGNCPIMGQRIKSCFICNKTDHLQAKCPEAWWNQRKKSAKLNSQHTSPHQEVSAPKTAALPPKTVEVSLVQTVSTEKEVVPALTSVVQTVDVTPTPTVVSDTASTIEDTPVTNQELLTVAAEHTNGAGTINSKEEQSTHPLEEETVEEMPESEVEDEDEEDEDELDVDMVEAEKEARATEIPLVDVVKAMRSKMKLNLRKSKKTKTVKSFDKDLVRLSTRSRTGGSAVMKKQSTNPASRK